MSKNAIPTIRIESITQVHQVMGLEKPRHPLFSIMRFSEVPQVTIDERVRVIFDFWQIALKKDCKGKIQYGQTMYDFDEGVMSYFAPKQLTVLEPGDKVARSGWLLMVHSDFLRTYPLGQKIQGYGFFEYAANEALILSEEEEAEMDAIFRQIEKEYNRPVDNFSQDVVVANLDLLLTYSNRYYNRQFIMRKPGSRGLLEQFDKCLNEYFEKEIAQKGLPTVKSLAERLHLSPNYLSDLLRQLTGQNTQQHIHDKLIARAKEKLSVSDLSVSEIAYELGFERVQAFSKLFKAKTSQSPVEYRRSFVSG